VRRPCQSWVYLLPYNWMEPSPSIRFLDRMLFDKHDRI